MYKHLTQAQRYYIYVERQKGSTQKSIAEAIGVSEATVSREIRRNGGKNNSYNFLKAQQKADSRSHRSPGNRAISDTLKWRVRELLIKEQWSPKQLFLPVMRTQGNDSHIHLGVVDFVNHAILLVDASRPRLFKDVVPQMLHLPRASAWMFLQFYQHVGNLLQRCLVATLFDDDKLSLGSLRQKYGIGHGLQLIDKGHHVVLALQPCKLGSRLMRLVNVSLHGFHVAGIGKEVIARRADVVRVDTERRLCELANQPFAVFLREREALDERPKLVHCQCCHNYIL